VPRDALSLLLDEDDDDGLLVYTIVIVSHPRRGVEMTWTMWVSPLPQMMKLACRGV
jgi:hypothetical protein